MDVAKFYSQSFDAIKDKSYIYLSWEGFLDPMIPMVLLIKRCLSYYKYRILFVVTTISDKFYILELLQNNGLIQYQLNSIDFVIVEETDFISDPKDLIIGFHLKDTLIEEDFQNIEKLRNLSQQNKPQIMFIDKLTDKDIKKYVESKSTEGFVSCFSSKEGPKPRVFFHEIDLKTNGFTENYKRKFGKISDTPEIRKTQYVDFICDIDKYQDKENLIIDIDCTEYQKYILLNKELREHKIDKKVSQKERIKNIKRSLFNRRFYLFSKKEDYIKKFLKNNEDKKIAVFTPLRSNATKLGFDKYLCSETNDDEFLDTVLKFNSGYNKDICIKSLDIGDTSLEKTEIVLITDLVGYELDLINEGILNEDINIHIFYLKDTIEDISMKKIMNNINPRLYVKINE